MNKAFFEAIATLIGTVIGAGIFAIPYVIAKAGFWTGILDIIIIGGILLLLHLYLGEVTLRTKGFHQLTGYAEKYLGKWGKRLMLLSMVFGIYGALTAYLIGEGQSLSALIGFGSPLLYSLIFFIIMSVLVYFGLKAIEEAEIFIVPMMILVVAFIVVLGLFKINHANLSGFEIKNVLIPYGIIFFAFFGTSAVPEMREELAKNEKSMRKAILLGMLIPAVIYLLFVLVTIGITGISTTQVATIGLGNILGEKMVIFGNLFAVFAMAACFLALALALKEMYILDLKIKKNLSWMLVCFAPILIFMAIRLFAGFSDVIAITGAFSGGIAGTLIVLMHRRAKKLGNRKPEYTIAENKLLGIILIAIFIIGMVYEILSIAGLI